MPGLDSKLEMRRLEALSNTIFGVAMTLLAYDLPRKQLTTDNPDWAVLWSTYRSPLLALLLGFIIAGMFWYIHQRRLVYAEEGTRLAFIGNLLFLLTIVALPLTTGLYGRYPMTPDVIVLFSLHLAAIAVLNLILWLMAVAPRGDWGLLAASAFTAIIFVVAVLVALVWPHEAAYFWMSAFFAPALAAYFERKQH